MTPRSNLLQDLRDTPSGTLRLTAGRHACQTVIGPALIRLAVRYPDIRVELVVDSALVDIVADRFDAGVRLGEQIAKDMIAVRVGADLRMAVVGSPDYFARNAAPETPHDLTRHACCNIRLPSAGGLYAWEFEQDGRPLNVHVDGPLVVNDLDILTTAAVNGVGLAMVMEDLIDDHIREGRLVRVLEDWCPPFPGYHLYYPSRKHASSAFTALLEELRQRAKALR